jgi:hypothetical protein
LALHLRGCGASVAALGGVGQQVLLEGFRFLLGAAQPGSQRCCMGRIMPPPTPTMRMPATVASTAISTGMVTVVAMPTWPRAAMMPSPMMKTLARLASNRP